MDDNHFHYGWNQATWDYKRAAMAEDLPNAEEIYQDPGCVEYPSPILKSWKSTQAWYEAATDIGRMMGLVPTHYDQESGMGHIHINCSKHDAAVITADAFARPYLTWLFAAPMGSKFCKSTVGSMIDEYTLPNYPVIGDKLVNKKKAVVSRNEYFMSIYSTHMKPKTTFKTVHMLETIDASGKKTTVETDDGEVDYSLITRRFTAFAYREHLNTVEMRFFDSAEDWKQQAEHVAFAQRYVEQLLKNAKRFTPAPYAQRKATFENLKEMKNQYRDNIDLCIKDFKDLITLTLELPWNRYEKYIEKNLVPAFEYGDRC